MSYARACAMPKTATNLQGVKTAIQVLPLYRNLFRFNFCLLLSLLLLSVRGGGQGHYGHENT
jgi:hypothetical protein